MNLKKPNFLNVVKLLSNMENETKEEFNILCVMEGTEIEENEEGIADFENTMKELFEMDFKYCETVVTLPDRSGPGGRKDIFFLIKANDAGKFAIPRIRLGVRWYEDVIDNMGKRKIYSKDILEKYEKYQ